MEETGSAEKAIQHPGLHYFVGLFDGFALHVHHIEGHIKLFWPKLFVGFRQKIVQLLLGVAHTAGTPEIPVGRDVPDKLNRIIYRHISLY
jgi:hypothetical protein